MTLRRARISLQPCKKASGLLLCFCLAWASWAPFTQAAELPSAPRPANQVRAVGFPVASIIADSLHTFLSYPGNNLSAVLPVESQIRAARLLQHILDSSGGVAITNPAAAILPPEAPAPSDALPAAYARENLETLNNLINNHISWHHFHDPQIVDSIIVDLAEQLSAGDQPARGLDLAKIRSAIDILRPPLIHKGRDQDNPWRHIFDGAKAQVAESDFPPVDLSKIVPRTAPHWRDVALDIMMAGSLNASRTTTAGRIYFAPGGLSHEQIEDLAAKNFRRAAEFVLDNADSLPLGLETALKLMNILADGLVPEDIRTNPYFNGDAGFHEEVRLFYEWLGSPEAAELASSHPIEMAERIHYIISVQDSFPDSNGRLSRLMADLVLIRAGLAPAYYTDIEDYFNRGSARAGVTLDQRRAYFHEVVARGQETMRMLEPLRETLDGTPKLSPAILAHIAETPGHKGAELIPEPRGSLIDYMLLTQAQAARHAISHRHHSWIKRFKTHVGKIRGGLDSFSGSYKRLVAGISILEGISIAMAATMAVYGIKEFGLLWAVVSTSLSIFTRIPGSWISAKIKNFLNPKQIYIAATIINALQILSLPLGLLYFGPHTMGYLAVYMVGQAVYGFVWGATYGMAESVIMPKVVGQERHVLETAKMLLMALKTMSSLFFAFILGPILSATVGMDKSIFIYALMAFAVLPLFIGVKLLPSASAASVSEGVRERNSPQAAQEESVPNKTRLSWSEAIPYMATMFMVFTFYTIFVGNFAIYRFNDAAHIGMGTDHSHFMSLLTIGFYNAGGAIISMRTVIPKLIASLEGKKSSSNNAGAMDTSSLKAWFGALALIAAFYLTTGMLGWQWINVIVGATALGVAIAVNRSQWMAYYMSVLDKKYHEKEASRLNGWPTAASFIPFAILSLGQILQQSLHVPLSLPFLLAAAIACGLALAVSWAISRRLSRDTAH